MAPAVPGTTGGPNRGAVIGLQSGDLRRACLVPSCSVAGVLVKGRAMGYFARACAKLFVYLHTKFHIQIVNKRKMYTEEKPDLW